MNIEKKTGVVKSDIARCGLKNTMWRRSILDYLLKRKLPVTAEEIFLELKTSKSSLSLSTVYRNLEALCSASIISKVTMMHDGKMRYIHNGSRHHHYMICKSCRTIVPFDFCPLQEFKEHITQIADFCIEDHILELYGYCTACR